MAAIHDYPLIAITEVFDLPSVDAPSDYSFSDYGTTESILLRKLGDVLGDGSDWNGGYGWTVETEFQHPIHIIPPNSSNPYVSHGISSGSMMGNGHHRLAFQALVQGALFVPYCEDMMDSGW